VNEANPWLLGFGAGTGFATCARMTAPRQILPGTTYLVTRRCSERRYFLRPSRSTNEIFRYVLAVVSERYGILLHAFCVLSNHVHIVLTDPHARLPEFHRDLDALVARAVNCAIGRWEAFWERDSYSAVRLETTEAIAEKMLYVLANPVAAGLVRRAAEWPGLWSDPRRIGAGADTVTRPPGFFRANGPLPATATLRLHPPPGVEPERLASDLSNELRRAEDRAAAELAVEGRSFLGATRVLGQNPSARPTTREVRGALSPAVATRNKWRRIEALLRLAEFRAAYRAALAAWRSGARDVVFPAGTWLMRVQHAVQCRAAA
jgi:REP element-mobilizing transposase RayT